MNRKLLSLLAAFTIVPICVSAQPKTLKDAYSDCWYTGVSVNQWQVKADRTGENTHNVTGQISNDQTADWPVIEKNFNWVVAENCMKCEVMHPKEGVYDFSLADQFVDRAFSTRYLAAILYPWHSNMPMKQILMRSFIIMTIP